MLTDFFHTFTINCPTQNANVQKRTDHCHCLHMYKPQCLTYFCQHQIHSPVMLCKDKAGVFWSNVMKNTCILLFKFKKAEKC